jgi:hypothetical protein
MVKWPAKFGPALASLRIWLRNSRASGWEERSTGTGLIPASGGAGKSANRGPWLRDRRQRDHAVVGDRWLGLGGQSESDRERDGHDT